MTSTVNQYYILAFALVGLAGLAFVGIQFKKQTNTTRVGSSASTLTVGKYTFAPEQNTLTYQSEVIPLSDKESKLLCLFAQAPNTILTRDFLLKEVWENEGVFVGRSLDMFVSKLRKKLQGDSCVRLINVHGKGYKMELTINHDQ